MKSADMGASKSPALACGFDSRFCHHKQHKRGEKVEQYKSKEIERKTVERKAEKSR